MLVKPNNSLSRQPIGGHSSAASRARKRTLRLTGALAVAVASSLVVAACTSQSGVSPTSPSQGAATDATRITTPSASGSLNKITWDLPNGEPTSLDWGRAFDYSSHAVLSNLCEGLVRQDPDYSIHPLLAKSIEHPDKLTYIYNIRQDVHFWDGNPLTADDVEASLKRELDPKSGAFWGVYFINVQSIEKTAPYQVTVRLKQPDEIFPSLLATYAGFVGEAIYVKEKGASYGTPSGGIMCTGPYKLQSWSAGNGLTIVRNDSYWNSSVKPKVGEIDFKFLTDPATLANALSAGEIDGAYEVPISTATKLQHTDSGTLYLGKSTQWVGALYSADGGAFADSRVREALWLAIDKDAIAKQVYQSTANPIRSANFPALWGFAPEVFKTSYQSLHDTAVDLPAARQLLKKANAAQATVTLAAQSDDPSAVQMAEIIQAAGKKIGLKVELKLMAGPQISALNVDAGARKGIDLFLANRFIDIADPMQLLNEFLPGLQYNYAQYDNAKFAAAVQGAYAASDVQERARLESEASTLLDKDWAILPLVNPAERLFMSKRVTGAPASFGYLYYPWAQDLGSTK